MNMNLGFISKMAVIGTLFLIGLIVSAILVSIAIEPTKAKGGDRMFSNLKNLFNEMNIADAASDVYEQTFTESMPTKTETDIDISHSHGNITVRGWDRDEVKIEGKKMVRAKDLETARTYAAQMKVEIKSEGDRIIVRTLRPEKDPSWRIRQITINYDLYAPTRLNVALKNEHGNVLVESFKGELKLNSRHGNLNVAQIGKEASIQHEHGNVEASHVGGNASVDKRHGNLELESIGGALKLSHEHGNVELNAIGKSADIAKRHGNLIAIDVGGATKLDHEHGDVQLKTIKGDLEMNKRHGNIDVETVNGNFSIASEHGNLTALGIEGDLYSRGAHGNLDVKNVAGSADVSRSHGNVILHNVKGAVSVKNAHSYIEVVASQPVNHQYLLSTEHANLRLAMPESSKVDLFARTEHGTISSDLPISITKMRHESAVEGKINSGGPKVELSTRHGNITIDATR